MTMKRTLYKIRRFFCFFSGEDDFIISFCTTKTQLLFSLIGFFVILIFGCCFWSSYLFVSNLFHNEFLGLIISLIVALIFTNLYLLILYTVSPPLLPAKKQVSKGGKLIYKNEHVSIKSGSIGVSLLLRLSLLLLIALFIVQPFNVLIFSDAPDHGRYAFEIKYVLSHNKLTWVTNIVACLIFLFPVYWKYMIRNVGEFYELKQKIEHEFINRNYITFRNIYSSILTQKIKKYNQQIWTSLQPDLFVIEKTDKTKFDKIYEDIKSELYFEKVEKYEHWSDPPFRTSPKSNFASYSSEDEFLKMIYPDSI